MLAAPWPNQFLCANPNLFKKHFWTENGQEEKRRERELGELSLNLTDGNKKKKSYLLPATYPTCFCRDLWYTTFIIFTWPSCSQKGSFPHPKRALTLHYSIWYHLAYIIYYFINITHNALHRPQYMRWSHQPFSNMSQDLHCQCLNVFAV